MIYMKRITPVIIMTLIRVQLYYVLDKVLLIQLTVTAFSDSSSCAGK